MNIEFQKYKNISGLEALENKALSNLACVLN
jgi:hypothetical protein